MIKRTFVLGCFLFLTAFLTWGDNCRYEDITVLTCNFPIASSGISEFIIDFDTNDSSLDVSTLSFQINHTGAPSAYGLGQLTSTVTSWDRSRNWDLSSNGDPYQFLKKSVRKLFWNEVCRETF